MEFRICRSSLGRYKVQRRKFLFWKDCGKPVENIKIARIRKEAMEEVYNKKKKEKEIWQPLAY